MPGTHIAVQRPTQRLEVSARRQARCERVPLVAGPQQPLGTRGRQQAGRRRHAPATAAVQQAPTATAFEEFILDTQQRIFKVWCTATLPPAAATQQLPCGKQDNQAPWLWGTTTLGNHKQIRLVAVSCSAQKDRQA